MKRGVLSLLLIGALHASGASLEARIVSTPLGVVVAHDERIELQGRWDTEGVLNPTEIVANDRQVVVLDALANEAVVVALATGKATRHRTAETPIAAAFLGDEIYVLARDARVLQRIGGQPIALSADPSFLRAANGRLYVYSRVSGALEEITGRTTRRIQVAPFASDLETDGKTAYLAYPREALIRTIDLPSMKVTGSVAVGAVPVDIALAGGGTAISGRVLAVADPSAKRVWLTEGRQSMASAVARGFVRGFFGLGLFAHRASAFPTGVDRVLARGSRWIAYDSSSGTLYRVTKQKSSVIAREIEPGAFALTPEGIAWWQGGKLTALRLH
jgi:hypothetical protein